MLLSYSGCSTCSKAAAWLRGRGVQIELRAIVEFPPTKAELAVWVPRSGRTLRQWLNTSGLSYRALGKERIASASDADIAALLAIDGKLVKRPVLVSDSAVIVGFDVAAYERAFGAGTAHSKPGA